MKWVTRGLAGSVVAGWVLVAPLALGEDVSRKPQVPDLKVERYTLPNGLTVLLHEDHKTPVAAVNVFYRVGSKDEKPGRTGFAHLFEHMMFLGSKHHDEDFSRPLERLGAENNASTDDDHTEYYERVPSNALERALWLEADRMGFLLPAMTQEKLDKERDVVKNERRETVNDAPYGQADEVLREALYPEGHPYHHSVIGSMSDLTAAGLADVSAFFRTYYAPDNAILCVAGDFAPEQVRGWIARYFGPLPRGPQVTPPRPNVPTLSAPKIIRITDAVSLPRLQLVWPTVPAGHPDEPALDVLAAVLGGLDKENRLFRELIFDRQLAASVSASHPTQVLAGTFEVDLYAHPDQKLDALLKIADAQIERLKQEGPTTLEVRKAQNQQESGLIMGLQSVTRKAAVFNEYTAIFGDPLAYRTELAKIFAITPEDVRRVARKYLGANRIELKIFSGQTVAKAAPTARGCRQARCDSRAGPAQASAATVAEVKDGFARDHPRARSDAPLPAAPVQTATALQRPGIADRREARAAHRDGGPGLQIGRDPHPQGEGGIGLAGRESARRRDDLAARAPTGRRAVRDRGDPQGRWRARIEQHQPERLDPSPGPCPGPLRGRRQEPVVSRQGAGKAETPAIVAPQGPHR